MAERPPSEPVPIPPPGTPGIHDPDTRQVRIASGVNVLIGIWLVLAPWVLSYRDSATAVANQTASGIAITVLALIRIAAPARLPALSWVNFLLGAWLLLSPFVLPREAGIAIEVIIWNNVIAGMLVLAMAVWSAMATQQRR